MAEHEADSVDICKLLTLMRLGGTVHATALLTFIDMGYLGHLKSTVTIASKPAEQQSCCFIA